MSNKLYDILKDVQVILAALAPLYLALAQIWGLPYGEQISGSIMAIDAFLGAILKVSNIRYKKAQEEQGDE